MSRKRVAIFGFLLILCATILPAQADFSIRYYNKEIYYTDSNIRLKVSLINNSSSVYRFKIADSKVYNFEFTVKTPDNRFLPASLAYQRSYTSGKPQFFREMSLEPGEEFSFLINLDDYITLDDPGNYYIESIFYPELNILKPENRQYSNRIPLSVRYGSSESDSPDISIREEKQAILAEEKMAPDAIISYTLTARQKSQWAKFFLYLDTESLMLENPLLKRKFGNSSEEEKAILLEHYEESLREGDIDGDQPLIAIPESFSIEHTAYDNENAQVVALEYFGHEGYTEIKEYTYYLSKQDEIWKITHYDVVNMGTR